MANTKKLEGENRKKTKRGQRKALKKLFQSLDRKQRADLKKEKQGLRQFIAKQQKAE